METLTKEKHVVSYKKKEVHPCANIDNKHVAVDNNAEAAEYEYDDPQDSPYYEEDKWLYDQADEILRADEEDEEEYRLGKRKPLCTWEEINAYFASI